MIATKGGNTRPGPNQWVPDGRPEYLAQCVDKSLKRLKLERIDLYQLHRIDRKVPVEESLGALKTAQDAGKIRHVGLSEVTVAEIEQAKKVLPIVSIQNQYNITDRDSEGALNYCAKEKMGFIPWAPIGGGRNPSLRKTGNVLEAEAKRHNVSVVQLALAWLLQKSPVMLPIPGTSSLAHLEENMAAEKLQLSAEEWKRSKSWRGELEKVESNGREANVLVMETDLAQLAHDRFEIADALHRYAFGLDHGDADSLASALTEDCRFDFRPAGRKLEIDFPLLTGRDAILNGVLPLIGPLDTSHSVSNLQIEIVDDTATLYAYVLSQHFLPREGPRRGSEYALLMNRYDCNLMRDRDKWRFNRITIDNAWALGNPEILNALASRLALRTKSKKTR